MKIITTQFIPHLKEGVFLGKLNKTTMYKKVIGTTEDRLNRFMQMCLEWQRDLRSNVNKPAAHYFTNYHIGKVKRELMGDLRTAIIDRDWAIDKMNSISLFRAENEINLGHNAQNRTIYNQNNRKTAASQQLELFDNMPKATKVRKNVVSKRKPTGKFDGISDAELFAEVMVRYKNLIEKNKR